jgi:hypothetical protein
VRDAIGYGSDRTGFGEIVNPASNEVERASKTLCDWMDQLLGPAILAFGSFYSA